MLLDKYCDASESATNNAIQLNGELALLTTQLLHSAQSSEIILYLLLKR
jgi:hypothetical protein